MVTICRVQFAALSWKSDKNILLQQSLICQPSYDIIKRRSPNRYSDYNLVLFVLQNILTALMESNFF